jgi:hypothetical protein
MDERTSKFHLITDQLMDERTGKFYLITDRFMEGGGGVIRMLEGVILG